VREDEGGRREEEEKEEDADCRDDTGKKSTFPGKKSKTLEKI